jgi:hypothetical protein
MTLTTSATIRAYTSRSEVGKPLIVMAQRRDDHSLLDLRGHAECSTHKQVDTIIKLSRAGGGIFGLVTKALALVSCSDHSMLSPDLTAAATAQRLPHNCLGPTPTEGEI